MKNFKIVLLILVVGLLMTSCGSLFPNTAIIVIQNTSDNSYDNPYNRGIAIKEYFNLLDVYIYGAGIETGKSDIDEDEVVTYNLSWYGDRSDFKIGIGTYEYHISTPGDSSVILVEDVKRDILDIGHDDVVSVKMILDNSAVPSVEVDKQYKITSKDRTITVDSHKQ